MAISVNEVYKTVLLILNKEQRGYITPDEFNKISNQVQLEIFEKYFEDLNQQLRVPLQAAQMDDDYANRIKSIEEKIQIFQTQNSLTYNNGTFSLDADKPAIHRIGSLQYEKTGLNATELQRLTQHEYALVQRSKLTAPTESWPVYKEQGDLFYVYPSTIQNRVVIYYVKKPTKPRWGYTIGGVGQYLYDNNIYIATGLPLVNNYFFNSITTPFVQADIGSPAPTTLTYSLKTDGTSTGVTYTGNGTGMEFTLIMDAQANIAELTVTAAGSGYSNTDTIVLSAATFQAGATVTNPVDAVITFDDATLYSGTTFGSTQFEIDSIDQTELVINILKYCGIVIREPQIIQSASQMAVSEDNNEKS
jgi:hypothetical protein